MRPASPKSVALPAAAVAVFAAVVAAGCATAPPAAPANGAAGATLAAAAEAGTARRWQAFVDRWMDDYWQHHATRALYAGVYRNAGQMELPSDEARALQRAWLDDALSGLDRVDATQLDTVAATDLALMRAALERERWGLVTFKAWQWDPSSHRVAGPIELLLNTDYAPLEVRLRAAMARQALVPAFYAAAQASIEQPTLEHTDLAIRQSQGALATFGDAAIARARASALTSEEKARYERTARDAQAAIERWVAFLQQQRPALVAGSVRSFRLGPGLYERKFKLENQTGFTAADLHERALAEKAWLHDQMALRAAALWPRYFAAEPPPADRLVMIRRLLDRLSLEHVAREGLVAEVKRQLPLLQAFVRDHDLLSQDPRRPLTVRETPAYMRGEAAASISAPGPYDAGRETFYNVAAMGDYTPGQAESFLREYNRWTLQILNIHEAIPGHYTQLVHANRSPSIVKAVFGDGAMIEGWAVYGERMMLTAGWGGDEPELWLFWMKWNLRSVCNTLLDIGVHTRGMTRDQALDLLQREAFQQETEAVEKWRRVSQSSVQLTTYFAGYAAIWQFRQEEEKRLGAAFDLKAFHERFLSYGSAPVPLIKASMREGR